MDRCQKVIKEEQQKFVDEILNSLFDIAQLGYKKDFKARGEQILNDLINKYSLNGFRRRDVFDKVMVMYNTDRERAENMGMSLRNFYRVKNKYTIKS